MSFFNKELFQRSLGIPAELPPSKKPSEFGKTKRRPKVALRGEHWTAADKRLALKNALRYFPVEFHEELAPEFLNELEECGHIYMYRFCPYGDVEEYKANMKAFSFADYNQCCASSEAAAIMLMIQNNLDYDIAQFPFELITYGSNGAVFQNWIQYRLTMQYLSGIENDQTLAMYSGHPLGVFPSHIHSPRVVITNGMMIPEKSALNDYNSYNALGVTQYGQMTAGSYMYIGSQGIVHGTALTLLNATRERNAPLEEYGSLKEKLKGKLFVSSGLGGMSGAQAKAAEVLGAVAIIAEVNIAPIETRKKQGWVTEIKETLDQQFLDEIRQKRENGESVSYAYHGNIVELWEFLDKHNVNVDLGSDQTSLHNPYDGGYCPVGLQFSGGKFTNAEFEQAIASKEHFITLVHESLRRQVDAINSHVRRGMKFFEYGNSLLSVIDEVAGIHKEKKKNIPSYVLDIMGPRLFDYGFGPFRWVCTSGDKQDLLQTDHIAQHVLEHLYADSTGDIKQQYYDNIVWVKEADGNNLVVGSQARILYADAPARVKIALAFNNAIAEGKISAPIVLGRDHHDVSGTDSPFRETNNILDGSNVTADMAVQNVIGDAFRGATWVSIHNGGGVGWGKAINGGFGMVIEGTKENEERIRSMLFWDVNNGIARRSWAGNDGAIDAIKREMERSKSLRVTLPNKVLDGILDSVLQKTRLK